MHADRTPTPAEAAARVAHEDLLIFINACFACTGQREFYSDGHQQTVAIGFLHEYIRGNYRRLYALCLAAGINDYNRGRILVELLVHAGDVDRAARREEGALIAAALAELPPPRAYRVLAALRVRRVNNRRARAIVREYLDGRRDLAFDAVKYRGKLRALARHAHLRLPGEVGSFVAQGWKQRRYATPLFDAFRRAHHSAEAIYELPYTVAEGLAARMKIDRAVFLERIAGKMTRAERMRTQESARRAGAALEFDLAAAPLTRLALHVLGLPEATRRADLERLDAAMRASARRALERAPLRLGSVVCVLDRSSSSAGSEEKRRRPLAVALATRYLVEAASDDATFLFTPEGDGHPLLLGPSGQTDLATPLLGALGRGPELLLIVSDGWENDPPGAAARIARLYRRHLDPGRRTAILHLNPVFEATELGPKAIDPAIPTLGVRDAEDLPTLLAFARFVDGALGIDALEANLEARAAAMLGRHARRRARGPGADDARPAEVDEADPVDEAEDREADR